MDGGGFDPATGYGLTATSATTDGGQDTDPAPDRTTLTSSGDVAGLSHLDSFFASSGWTREDVLVVAAALDVVMFAIVIYLEVSE